MIAASSGSGGASSEPPAQPAPSRSAKALACVVARPHEGEKLAALPARDLGDDVRGGAETVEPEPPALARHHQRAPADQARAQQRRACSASPPCLAERKHIAGVGDGLRGVAAVAGVAGEQRVVAEVFLTAAAIGAGAVGDSRATARRPARRDEARHARAERVDPADDLMAGNERQLRARQFAVDHVQVGAADAAGRDAHPDLARPRLSDPAAPACAAARRDASAPSRALTALALAYLSYRRPRWLVDRSRNCLSPQKMRRGAAGSQPRGVHHARSACRRKSRTTNTGSG